MKEVSISNRVRTYSLDFKDIPEGFMVDIVCSEEYKYKILLYNTKTSSNKMLIGTVYSTSIKEIERYAEKSLKNPRYHYDDIEEYCDVYLDATTYNKYFGLKTA